MKFGVTVVPRISDWKLFVDLETMGYDAAWAADSQMLYSDAYATLALAAVNTSRIVSRLFCRRALVWLCEQTRPSP